MSEKPELLPWTMTKGDFGHWNAHLNGKLVYSAKKEWVQKYVDDRNEAFEMGRRSSAPQAQGAGKVAPEEFVKELKGVFENIERCDKTEYGYGKGKLAQNRFGELPEGVGKRWKTPAEIARETIREIDEAIAEFEGEVQAALTSAQERDMTPEEALAEARRRWGPNGWVEAVVRGNIRKTFEVGAYEWDKSVPPARVWTRHWTAGNFRTAFAEADKAQGGEKP